MSEINRLIAEARGYSIVEEKPGVWVLRLNGEYIRSREYNFDHEHDYEHDLNAAWSLLAELPDGGITPTEVSWFIDGAGAYFEAIEGSTPQDAANAICRAYCKVVLHTSLTPTPPADSPQS